METATPVTNEPPLDAEQKSAAHDAEEETRQSLWADLGLTEPEFLDDSLAPDVDEGLLRRLVRQELPEKIARAVYRRIYSFASWHHAHAQVLLDELKKSRQVADP
ncbi:MAG: hypothetical protein ACREHD_11065 [Pirellulales bacterium]